MEDLSRVKNSLEKAENIDIVVKEGANKDALSASLALFFALKKIGKNVYLPLKNDFINKAINNNNQKLFISFKEDVSEIFYEKTDQGVNLYLTPLDKEINPENFSCEIITNNESQIQTNNTELIISVNNPNFEELEEIYKERPDLLYGATIINIDNNNSNQNYGELNLIDPISSISQTTACVLHAISKTLNKKSSDFALLGMFSSQNFDTTKTVPTIKWLLKNNGDFDIIDKSNHMKLLEKTLRNINLFEKENIYISTLASKDLEETKSSSKDLGYIIEQMKILFNIPSFLLLWESDSLIKGIFYTDEKRLLETIKEKFDGAYKESGAIFVMKQENISLAKKEVISLF